MSTSQQPVSSSAHRPPIGVGDIVGISLTRYNKRREITGSFIAVRGRVERLYRTGPRTKWRAGVLWENGVQGFLYTGKDGWEYVHNLTLVKRYIPYKQPHQGPHQGPSGETLI